MRAASVAACLMYKDKKNKSAPVGWSGSKPINGGLSTSAQVDWDADTKTAVIAFKGTEVSYRKSTV